MAHINAQDFIRLAKQRCQELDRVARENAGAQKDYETKRAALQETRHKTLTQLAELLLPALQHEPLAAIYPLTNLRAFEVNDAFAQLEQRRHELSATVVAIEKDPLYLQREQRLNELTPRRQEILRKKGVLDQGLAVYTNEKDFVRLVECCYGTPLYSKKWWDLSYYTDWKRGDELEEKLSATEGLVSFAALAERYKRVKAAVDGHQRDLSAVEGQISAIQGLVETREKSLQGLMTAARDMLEKCRADLRAHLEYLDREELGQRCAGRQDLLPYIKKLHGVEKQIEYLDELRRHYLQPESELIKKHTDKLNRKIVKYSRPKNYRARIPATEANSMLADPRPKIKERRKRYLDACQRVHSFHDYNRYQYGANALWWDVILGGLLAGEFVPEVSDYRQRFPQGPQRREVYAATLNQPRRTDDRSMLEVS